MADWPGNGGGTVSSSDICNVSPSDQIGTLDNILNRLQALETVLAGLLGTNVEAVQLSDISNDLGWIYNVSYLGTEGWTKTPSGTLIPPSGWTGLSSIVDGLSGLILYSNGSEVVGGSGSSFPYAALVSLNGIDTIDNSLISFSDSSPRSPQTTGTLSWRINTSGYTTGIYLVVAGIFGTLTSNGYSYARIQAQNYPGNGPTSYNINASGGGIFIGETISTVLINPGNYIDFDGLLYDTTYRGFSRAWFSAIRLIG